MTLLVGVLAGIGGWWARRPKDVADARAVAAQTDISIAAAMQTQYAKLVADLAAEVDRRRTLEAGLRADIETDKDDCRKRIAAIQADLDYERAERRSMGEDMAVLVLRIEQLEDRLRANGLDANGAH